MITKNMTIQIPTGLEARPVAIFVQVASRFESSIYVEVGTKRVNAKSIMGMMSLRLLPGEKITVVTDGKDEEAAASGIERFFINVKNQ